MKICPSCGNSLPKTGALQCPSCGHDFVEKLKPWTEEELDEMSRITDEDITNAQEFARKVSPVAAALLDAKPEKKKPSKKK